MIFKQDLLASKVSDSGWSKILLSPENELQRQYSQIHHCVVQISNISWDLSSLEIVDFLSEYRVSVDHVHIPIDRSTGKTRNEMFVELSSILTAINCIQKCNKKVIKNRALSFTLSSFEELHEAHFPNEQAEGKGAFVSKADVNSIINICRSYKVSTWLG
jgi:RNA recognition motif-containing protein